MANGLTSPTPHWMWKLSSAVLSRLPPEKSHDLSLAALRSGLIPNRQQNSMPGLATRIASLKLSNPVGLAAGADKNGMAISGFLGLGLGFVEVGCVTPRPQPGNLKPRVFRLERDQALINRLGLNNDGSDAVAKRAALSSKLGVVGLNVGYNKGCRDPVSDYVKVIEVCGRHVDYLNLNVSCPNQETKLDPQNPEQLQRLLEACIAARDTESPGTPLFLKLSPDLPIENTAEIADLAVRAGIDALVATNTTTSRMKLRSVNRNQWGGLSGQPLFELSTRVLARVFAATRGKVPLIGVGGISSPDQAYAKITAGASAVQLYTALTFQGPHLVQHICEGLSRRLEQDGYRSIDQAVGTKTYQWL